MLGYPFDLWSTFTQLHECATWPYENKQNLMIIDLKEVNTVVSSEQSQLPLQVLKNPGKVFYDDKSR